MYLLLDVGSSGFDTFFYVRCNITLSTLSHSTQQNSDTVQDRYGCLNDILSSWLMVGSMMYNSELNDSSLSLWHGSVVMVLTSQSKVMWGLRLYWGVMSARKKKRFLNLLTFSDLFFPVAHTHHVLLFNHDQQHQIIRDAKRLMDS